MMAQQYCKRWRHKLFHGHGAPKRISLTSDQSVERNRESGDVWTNAESAITDGHGLMKLGKGSFDGFEAATSYNRSTVTGAS